MDSFQVLFGNLKAMGIKENDELASMIRKYFIPQTINKGSYFLKEGQVCKQIGFLTSGMMVHYHNVEGDMLTRWVSLENNFTTSLSSFIEEVPSNENLLCIQKSELLVCNKEDFLLIKDTFWEMQQVWIFALERELIGYEKRVCSLITLDAKKRYLNFMKVYPEFIQKVPQKYIASMLGIEPRHLSRIRKEI